MNSLKWFEQSVTAIHYWKLHWKLLCEGNVTSPTGL